jgi:hypothetical protein
VATLNLWLYRKIEDHTIIKNLVKAERQRLINEFKEIDNNIVMEERKNVFYLKGMLQPTKSIGDFYLKHKEHYVGED